MRKKAILVLTLILCISCKNQNNKIISNDNSSSNTEVMNEAKTVEITKKIDVNFSLGKKKEYNNIVVEDINDLKKEGKEHSVKYYSYMPENPTEKETFPYFDVGMNQRYMRVDKTINENTYKWSYEDGVFSKTDPKGCKMSYGIDVSKHNGNIDFKKVKKAGFDFAFVRIAYRGYGKAGNLKEDEMYKINLKNAKEAGLKVGAYVFSQAIDEKEAIEEAKFAISLLKDYKLDLPVVFDPETIKGDIARTDNIDGNQFTKNAIAFLEEIKKAGFKPAIYSNLVWEDYYFDFSKLSDYEIWYADYSKLPQTPYDFKYWQFSEIGLVDGVKGEIDLNVMIERVD